MHPDLPHHPTDAGTADVDTETGATIMAPQLELDWPGPAPWVVVDGARHTLAVHERGELLGAWPWWSATVSNSRRSRSGCSPAWRPIGTDAASSRPARRTRAAVGLAPAACGAAAACAKGPGRPPGQRASTAGTQHPRRR